MDSLLELEIFMRKVELSETYKYVLDNIKDTFFFDSNVFGIGLFAEKKIPVGSVLAIMDGQLISVDKFLELKEMLSSHMSDFAEMNMFAEVNFVEDTKVLYRPFRTKYSFIQTSDNFNVALTPISNGTNSYLVMLTALKDIYEGEELLRQKDEKESILALQAIEEIPLYIHHVNLMPEQVVLACA